MQLSVVVVPVFSTKVLTAFVFEVPIPASIATGDML